MKKYFGLVVSSLFFFTTFFLAGCSLADVQPFLEGLTHSVAGWASVATVIAGIVIEVIVRIWPTANPVSLIRVFAGICRAAANLATGFADFLDRLGFQNLKRL